MPCFTHFPRKKVEVDEIFVHENYETNGSKGDDIALLRLSKNILNILENSLKKTFESFRYGFITFELKIRICQRKGLTYSNIPLFAFLK